MGVVEVVSGKCRRCNSCRRVCPVKALKSEEGGSQRVVEEACIGCGLCADTCTQGGLIKRDDTGVVSSLLALGSPVVALLDPSFPVGFLSSHPGQVIAGLKALGFASVHITSSAATPLLVQYKRALQSAKDIMISSACTAVVSLITKHYPDLVPFLAPVVSLAQAAARVARRYGRPGARIVFIGPCVASKLEADGASAIDAVLTFQELKELLGRDGVDLHGCRAIAPDPMPWPERDASASDGDGDSGVSDDPRFSALALPGGLSWLLGIFTTPFANDLVVACGKQRCLEVMTDLASEKLRPRFVDALFCRGCVDAPGVGVEPSLSERKKLLFFPAGLASAPEGEEGWRTRPSVSTTSDTAAGKDGTLEEALLSVGLERRFSYCGAKLPIPTENEIGEILAFCDLADPSKQLNCGLCGYPTCRELAVAVYQGFAREDACVPYLIARMEGKMRANDGGGKGAQAASAVLDEIYGSSEAISKARALSVRAARGDSTVLITGESGTGKEVFAQTIHALSDRRNGPFVSVNCAAIPETLMETELLGYASGAFTGATKGGKPGKFELANRGSIFLDEIGDMSLSLQAKLLRVVQDRTVERVGGVKGTPVDVRIIAATNHDLTRLVAERRFRLDLYYRLNVISINLPPLRERPEDIPAICRRSLVKLNARCGTDVRAVASEAMKALLTYDWPGNVRELENVLERALNLVDGDVIGLEHLPDYVLRVSRDSRDGGSGGAGLFPSEVAGSDTGAASARELGGETLESLLWRVERERLAETLEASGGNKAKAARKLGISRSAFYEKLARYGLDSVKGGQVPFPDAARHGSARH